MIFFIALAILGLSILFCVYRAAKGPTPFDRILSISSIGTIMALGIAVHGFAFNRPDFVDIALMYILLNFLFYNFFSISRLLFYFIR